MTATRQTRHYGNLYPAGIDLTDGATLYITEITPRDDGSTVRALLHFRSLDDMDQWLAAAQKTVRDLIIQAEIIDGACVATEWDHRTGSGPWFCTLPDCHEGDHEAHTIPDLPPVYTWSAE